MTPFTQSATLATVNGWTELAKPGSGNRNDFNYKIENFDDSEASIDVTWGDITGDPTDGQVTTKRVLPPGTWFDGRRVLKGNEAMHIRVTGGDVRVDINGLQGLAL